MSDCTVRIDEGLINIRVGAIILKDNKFLMVKDDRAPYYYSVGGRVKFGETAQEAIIREVYEELGMKLEIDRLGFIHENYFYEDYDSKERLFYEISYFFYMKLPDQFELPYYRFQEGNHSMELVWITPDCTTSYFPQFFKTELLHPKQEIIHIVTDGRKS